MNNPRTCNLLGAFITGMHGSLSQRIVAESSFGGESAAAIVTIGHNQSCTIDFLSRTLELSHSGAVRLVDKLEDSKLVKRQVGEDKRAVALVLTDLGRRRMQSILRTRRKCLHQALNALNEREQKQLVALLERMLAQMTENDDTAESICKLCEVNACPQGRCPVTLAAEKQSA